MNFNNIPQVTRALIIINALVFLFTHIVNPSGGLMNLFAIRYFGHPDFGPWQLITAMFTHGSFSHFFFNMFALFMFGSAVERAWGAQRFLSLYMVAGIGAALINWGVQYYMIQDALAQLPANAWDVLISSDGQQLPGGSDRAVANQLFANFNQIGVGASGAIFGVLVAFGMMFPNVELMLIFLPIPIKAKYFIPIMMVLELFMGVQNFSWDNIGHWTHLGGAVVGFLFTYFWKKKKTVFY